MFSFILQVLSYFLVGYLVLLFFMYLRQENFLFFPNVEQHLNHDYPNVEMYSLVRGDVTLKGWLVNPAYCRDKLYIYFGGNAEDVFNNIEEFSDLRASSLFVAYRGYGPSNGTPGERELFSDCLALIDDMTIRYSPKEIYLVGRSLGTGVACYGASQRAVQGLVLITPYDSIENVASQAYPWVPVKWLLRHKFLSIKYLPKVRCPILVIYAGQDKVVRPERTRNLIAHIVGEKEVVLLERADHGTVDMFPKYWESLLDFTNRNR